jgi:hypothetical protein
VSPIAKYRTKDDLDLRWNRIRRRLTRELDTQIADWREEALNRILAGAWEKYTEAISSGKVLELEARYETFVGDVLDDVIDAAVDDEAA